MPIIDLQLLGAFHISRDQAPLPGFDSERVRALMAYLAVDRSHPHRRTELAALLWPDQTPDIALANLRQTLNRARRGLGVQGLSSDVLEITRHTVAIAADAPLRVDIDRFVAEIAATQSHPHRRLSSCLPCIERLERAASLYQAPFCEDLGLGGMERLEEWCLVWRERLRAMALQALSTLTRHHQQRGDYARAENLARRQLEIEDMREEAHRQMMRALVLSGRRAEALSQYQRCRRLLKRELDVEPAQETTALYERIRSGEDVALIPASLVHNLPSPTTPFVGRERELGILADRLAAPDHRLVTLIGPCGAGKTRLAIEIARQQVGAFADGICYVSLERLLPGEHMLYALNSALGLPFHLESNPRAQLERHLASREMLLIIDQMERAADQNGLLAELLVHAPGLQLLVTHIVPLGLAGESTLLVQGLAMPDDPEDLTVLQSDAAQLLLSSARSSGHPLELVPEDALRLGRLLRAIDGLPLALELAAQWTPIFGLVEILEQFREDYEFLGTRSRTRPGRQRNVGAAMRYVWERLSEPARQVALALAAADSTTAGQLMQDHGLGPGALGELVDHPLVVQETDGSLRLINLACAYLREERASPIAKRAAVKGG